MSSFIPSPSEPRIEILDGFRCIAVMAVILYHYFYWFGSELEGFTDFPSVSFLSSGYFGVHLFFMISGFVIYRSMEQSLTLGQFLSKRYVRLAPAMILCSIITYTIIKSLIQSERLQVVDIHNPLSFLFSFTFIHPDIWNTLLDQTDIRYIDGAYWSLWAEVIFYIFAGIVYFNSRRENFVRNWILLAFVLNVLRIATSPKLAALTPEFLLPVSHAYYSSFLFLNINQWIYFSIGILFYSVWTHRGVARSTWTMASILLLFEMYFIQEMTVRILLIAAIGLWTTFLVKPAKLAALQWRPVQVIGLISYPLYLLHEAAGVVLTESLITWTDHRVPVPVLLTIVLAAIILLSYVIFSVFEKNVSRVLRTQLLGIR